MIPPTHKYKHTHFPSPPAATFQAASLADTHRNHCEGCVYNPSTYGSVDWLLHPSFWKDFCRIVENLKKRNVQIVKEHMKSASIWKKEPKPKNLHGPMTFLHSTAPNSDQTQVSFRALTQSFWAVIPFQINLLQPSIQGNLRDRVLENRSNSHYLKKKFFRWTWDAPCQIHAKCSRLHQQSWISLSVFAKSLYM